MVYIVDRDVTYAAMMMAHGLGEKTLVSDAQRRSPYPQVVFSGDVFGEKTAYTVIADNVEVVTCSNIVAAITACFVVHWIFDIQYPTLFKNILTFLDVHVFQKRSVRATQKVLTYINRFWVCTGAIPHRNLACTFRYEMHKHPKTVFLCLSRFLSLNFSDLVSILKEISCLQTIFCSSRLRNIKNLVTNCYHKVCRETIVTSPSECRMHSFVAVFCLVSLCSTNCCSRWLIIVSTWAFW